MFHSLNNIHSSLFTLSYFKVQTLSLDTAMRRYSNSLQPGPVSQAGTAHSDFEFPIANFGGASPNDVVFCGKVITRKTEPGPQLQIQEYSSGPTGGFFSRLRSPSGKENRYRKIGSSRKQYNGIFGTVKFPLQMDLSDMKTRQERREPMPLQKLPATAAEDRGGESCWELVRPLRRRGTLLSVLAKASFGCIPIV